MGKQTVKKTSDGKILAEVISPFVCKDTGTLHSRRDIIEVSRERFNQLKGVHLEKAPKGATLSDRQRGLGCPCC